VLDGETVGFITVVQAMSVGMPVPGHRLPAQGRHRFYERHGYQTGSYAYFKNM
jgi:hypothetical protein